ncbi:MAG: NAD-dependent epimerase/dehydratase family protein [Methylophilaceae bacterium]
MKFTVLGATGFIGSHLVKHLREQGHECFVPARGDPSIFTQPLGHVIYAIGLTADFRTRPFDTVRAHVSVLADVLEKAQFDSFLYLSSTRVYGNSTSAQEDVMLQASPKNPSDLYNLSKLMGESLCLCCGKANVRVARLSNVYGNDVESENFLTSIVRDALINKHITLHSALDSSKDYVDIRDVVGILPKITVAGEGKLYNVASGINVSNRELIEKLKQLTNCTVDLSSQAKNISFPAINISQIKHEFGFVPTMVVHKLDMLVSTISTAQSRDIP